MKILRITGRAAIIVLCSLLALILLVWGGLNIAKYAIYSDYYSIKESLCKNPGLGDGFVCQGIAMCDGEDKILVSGYMKDKSASRIYVTDLDDNSYYVTLTKGGESFTGHAGGVAVTGDTVYLANGKRVYTFPLADLLAAKNGESVEIGEGFKVNNSASFVYTDESYLYVGEFHDGGAYITDHPYDTAEGKHCAIVSRYSLDDPSAPDRIYSIRDKVQGICFTPCGEVVMSTSYGLADTVYYVYNEADATDSGKTLDGAPVYYLEDCVKEIKGPAMGEDLDFYDGRIITLTESASDKYIFGKFFFANKIVSLDICK